MLACALGILIVLAAQRGPSVGAMSVGDLVSASRSAEVGHHDGLAFFAVALDPLGRHGTPALITRADPNGAAYRYRRIFFPAIAGGLGSFSPATTRVGLFVVLALAWILAGLAAADLAVQWNQPFERAAMALLSPAIILATWLLLADAIALALALGGLAAALRRRHGLAAALFACACLTKETYALLPVSLAAWSWWTGDRRGARRLAASVLPLLAWSLYLTFAMPAAGSGLRNFDLPFRGLLVELPRWLLRERNPLEWSAGLALSVAAWRAWRLLESDRSAVRWIVAPWLLLACLASVEVWHKPTDIARATAILWPLTVLRRPNA